MKSIVEAVEYFGRCCVMECRFLDNKADGEAKESDRIKLAEIHGEMKAIKYLLEDEK